MPEPQLQTSPPLDHEQIVNMASWLWIENWAPVSRSASAGSVTATVTAPPRVPRVGVRAGRIQGVHFAGDAV